MADFVVAAVIAAVGLWVVIRNAPELLEQRRGGDRNPSNERKPNV